GFEVTVVTTCAVLSPVSDETLEGDMLRAHLHRAGVAVQHATTITEIGAGSVTGQCRHGEPWSAACDGVVLVTQQASHDALYTELAGDEAALAASGISALYRIGDAVAPRMISEAIFDGHRLGRERDQPAQGQPARNRRERAAPRWAATPQQPVLRWMPAMSRECSARCLAVRRITIRNCT